MMTTPRSDAGRGAAPGRRIVVAGTTGSGKTTLARQLAARLGAPHIELDALYWDPDWTPAPREVFRQRIAEALRSDAWTVDGNYSAVRDIVWPRADTLIWLDYALPVTLGRQLRRTLRRIVTQEELWNGNRERWSAVFSRDSLVVWLFKTYRRRRREMPQLLALPEHAHLAFFRFRSPRAARRWLESLPVPARTADGVP